MVAWYQVLTKKAEAEKKAFMIFVIKKYLIPLLYLFVHMHICAYVSSSICTVKAKYFTVD